VDLSIHMHVLTYSCSNFTIHPAYHIIGSTFPALGDWSPEAFGPAHPLRIFPTKFLSKERIDWFLTTDDLADGVYRDKDIWQIRSVSICRFENASKDMGYLAVYKNNLDPMGTIPDFSVSRTGFKTSARMTELLVCAKLGGGLCHDLVQQPQSRRPD